MARVKTVCGECGAEVPAGATSCPSCGVALDREAESREDVALRCPVCGHQNGPGSAVCASCGARLGTRAKKPVPKPAAAPVQARKQERGVRGPVRLSLWQAAALVLISAGIVYVVTSEAHRPPAPRQSVAPQLPAGLSGPAAVDLKPLEEAVLQRPTDAGALLKLANAYHDAGLFQQAVTTYTRYLALNPRDPDARVDMGICYYELGRRDSTIAPAMFSEAITAMRAAFAASPTHQPAAFNLGIVNLTMGNVTEANAWLTKAVALNSTTDLGKRAQHIIDEHSFNR